MRNYVAITLLVALFFTWVESDPRAPKRGGGGNAREGKLFSLFSVVTFANDPCRTTSSLSSGSTAFRNGTCLTSSECSSQGGSGQGRCAAGFGVCCLFLNTEGTSTISRNCTYIQNPGFPSTLSSNSTSSVTYTINKYQPDVCTLRLDFEKLVLKDPPTAGETDGFACGDDKFQATVTSGQSIPEICGRNTGQHMYLELGGEEGDNAKLTFTFTDTSSIRTWDIKVTQLECFSPSAPPVGCLQYNTASTGRITTFNFDDADSTHLANQQYSYCIRPALGMCCVRYSVCSEDNSFSLHAAATGTPPSIEKAMLDGDCHDDTPGQVIGTAGSRKDYITIMGATTTCTRGAVQPVFSRFCGQRFSTINDALTNDVVCDCSPPFSVGIYTNDADDANSATAASNRGVCLEYQQIPC